MAGAPLLFHVSPREFKPGELVEPGHPRPDGSPSTHVYLASTRDRARYWALARSNVGEPARIHTYRVEPTGETEPDPEDPGTGQDFRTSSPVRVVRKMPGSVGPRQAALQVTGVSYEELDRHLEDWFHPQRLRAAVTRHPRSGYEVETGEELRMHQPRRGEGESPLYFHVLDHGDPHDPAHNSLLYPRETGQRPVEHVYRGVSAEELDQARKRGYVQSDGRGTIASWEGTNADPDPRTAVSYLPHGATGHILKIRVHPGDGWFSHEADGYARTRQPIPWSRVEAVSPAITKDQRYGAIERIGEREAAGVEDYGISHRPLRDGAPAHDLTEGYAEDIYTHPQYWAGAWPDKASAEGLRQLREARGKPDHPVTIYRASAPGTPYRINTGDWVSLSPTYAQTHAYNEGPGDDWRVHKAVVPASHVRDAGTDQYREQGYWGPGVDSEHHSGPRDGIRAEGASAEDYGISHRPDETGPPLHDMLEGDMMPRDFYDRMDEYDTYAHAGDIWGEASYQAKRKMRLFRGKPDKMVTIWRSAPAVNPESRNGKRGEINHGDWVGLSRHKALAESYEVNDPSSGSLPANHPRRYHIWSARVPARHVRNAAGDLTEWGYFGPDVKDIPHASETCSHRARVKPPQDHIEAEGVVQHFAGGETAPEGHQIWAVPSEERSPVAAEVYHNMTHREPADEHGSNWYQGISYHGPYHVIRHPQTRQVWVVDAQGRNASPTGRHYGNPERDGNWGEHQAWEHHYGLESAGPDAHRFGTWDEPRYNRMDERVPAFPHSRVDPEDEERVRRPEPRVHLPEGYSPSEEYHGSYEVVRHPETGRFHVVDNAGRHAMTGNSQGFGTQLQAERSRDYIEKRQQSKERAKGFADALYEGMHQIFDPGSTPESRESDRNLQHGQELMTRYEGGRGQVKFDDEEEGGRPYYEREHHLDNGRPSGWYVKHYGGTHADVYHRATGDDAGHDMIWLKREQFPDGEEHLSPAYGDEDLAADLKRWHDDEEGGARKHYERTNPAIRRWKQRHTGSALPDVVAHFEEPETVVTAAVQAVASLANPHTHGQEWFHGSPHAFGEFHEGNGSALEFETDPEDTSHWNTLLGNHFAASHEMAEEFSRGEHGSGMYGEEGPAGNIVHARLEMRNPRAYASEHDMDQEVYEHEFRAGNHHDSYYDPDEVADAREYGMEDELPRTYRYAGHGDRMRGQQEPDEEYRAMGHYHPYATGWLNAHPDKYGIAQRHRERLEAAGHDGITYGNEFEHEVGRGKAGGAHLCAVPFHAGQVDVTQRHTGPQCLPEHEASRQYPGRNQPMLPGFGHEGALVAHFEPGPLPGGPHMQQKLFHMQPDPTLHEPGSGRHNPEDPEGHLRWRAEHDERYSPDFCESCGHDLKMPRQHAERHQEWLGEQDWYTDWNEENLPDHIHRGIGVPLPPEVHRVVHDESRPVHERARALAAHLLSDENTAGGGVGNFWSAESDVSKHYAESAGRRYSRHGPQTPVMLHARTPGMEHIETDPETLAHWGVYSYHLAGNREVPVSHHAPVHLTGISWAPPGHEVREPHPQDPAWHKPGPHHLDQDPAWTHHDFGGGIQANATVSVVAHFEEPAPEDPKTYWDDLRPRVEAEHARTGEHERTVARMEAVAGPGDDRYAWSGEGGHSCPSCKHWWEHEAKADVSDMEPVSWGHMRRYGDPARGEECQYCNDRLTWPRPHTQAECPDSSECPSSMADILHGKATERLGPTQFIEEHWRHQEFDPKTPPHVEGDELFTPDHTRHHYRWGTPDDWHAELAEHHELAARERAEREAGHAVDQVFTGPEHDEARRYLEGNEGGSTHLSAMIPPPDQRSAREERSDRWHDYQNQSNDHYHRGIIVTLPDHLDSYVHDESVPREQRAAALQQHFADSGEGLGMHWTPYPRIAQRAIWNAASGDEAGVGAYSHGHGFEDYRDNEPYDDYWEGDEEEGGSHAGDGRHTEVMFHVRRPGERNRLPQREHDQYNIGWAHSRDEDEFPVRPGSPLRLAGISWKRHEPQYPNEPMEHVDFPKPFRHVSSRRLAAEEPAVHPAAIPPVVAHFGPPGHFEFYDGEGSEDGRPRTSQLEEHLHGHGGDLGHHYRLGHDMEAAWEGAYSTDPPSQRAGRYHQALQALHRGEHDRMMANAQEAVRHGASPEHPADVGVALEGEHHQQWQDEQDARAEHQRQVAEHLEDGEAHMHGRDVPFSEMTHHLVSQHGIPHEHLPEHRLPTSDWDDPYQRDLEEMHEQHHGDHSLPETGSYRHTPHGQYVTMHWGPRTDFDAEYHLVEHHGMDIDDLRHREPDLAAEHERDHAANRDYLDHHLYTVMDPDNHLPQHPNYTGPDAEELREGDPEHHFEVHSRDDEGNEHHAIYHAEDEDHAREMHENVHPYDEIHHSGPAPVIPPRRQYTMPAAEHGNWAPAIGPLQAPSEHGHDEDTAFHYQHQPYVAPARSGPELYEHLMTHHGVTHSPDSTKQPAQSFLLALHDKMHYGEYADHPDVHERTTPHQHESPEGRDPVLGSRTATRNHWDMTEDGMRQHLRDEHGIADPGEDPAAAHWGEHSGDTQRHVHPDLEREFVQAMNPGFRAGDAFVMSHGEDGGPIDPVFGSAQGEALVAHFGRGPVVLDSAHDAVLAPCAPAEAVIEAIGLLASWRPEDAAEAVLLARSFPEVLTALRDALLRVHRALEDMPVHPDVPEALYEAARGLTAGISDAERAVAGLPPEASWETPGSSPN